MKWTCQRCGLQRDDRRGSNCNGIQGQAHEWEETWLVKEKQEKTEWENWINSPDSFDWKNEFENIKKNILETVEGVQKQYIQILENDKINYNKNVFEIEKRKEEHNKKVDVYNQTKKENELLKKNIIPIGKGIWNKFLAGGIGFWLINILLHTLTFAIIFLFSIIIIPSIFRIIKNKSNYKKISLNNTNLKNFATEINKENNELIQYEYNFKESWKNYLNEINNKYEAGIEIIIQKGKQMIQENNQKHKVDKGLFYNDKLEYRKDSFNDNTFRKYYINDNEFVIKYNIGGYFIF